MQGRKPKMGAQTLEPAGTTVTQGSPGTESLNVSGERGVVLEPGPGLTPQVKVQ